MDHVQSACIFRRSTSFPCHIQLCTVHNFLGKGFCASLFARRCIFWYVLGALDNFAEWPFQFGHLSKFCLGVGFLIHFGWFFFVVKMLPETLSVTVQRKILGASLQQKITPLCCTRSIFTPFWAENIIQNTKARFNCFDDCEELCSFCGTVVFLCKISNFCLVKRNAHCKLARILSKCIQKQNVFFRKRGGEVAIGEKPNVCDHVQSSKT